MADTNRKDSCTNCLFFIEDGRMGTCKRYPTFLIKAPLEWCGEHKYDDDKATANHKAQQAHIDAERRAKEPARIEVTFVVPEAEVPKTTYDITTDQTTEVIAYNPEDAKDALLSIAKTLTAEPTPEPVKKPGRPKKVAK